MSSSRHLCRLFLRRFLENDIVSPDADRVAVISQTCAGFVTGGLFVTVMLSMQYLDSPFPLPGRTSIEMLRVQFLYASWSMIVMALVAVFSWDALALDSRDTAILGPLPVARFTIVRAKISALIVFVSCFAAALNLVPALIHPVLAMSRLRPAALAIPTLVMAHIVSTMAASAFGFAAVLGLREFLHAVLGTGLFRRVSLVVQAALVVALLTTLLLVPGFSFGVVDRWLARGTANSVFLPPFWFVGIHDAISGHVWAPLPLPQLPPRFASSESALRELYRVRRPMLWDLAFTGAVSFAALVVCSAVAYLWNNRKLPDPPRVRATEYGGGRRLFDWTAGHLLVRQPLMRAGFFFTLRVLARSAQNRLPIAIGLAVAIAVGTVALRSAGIGLSLDFSTAPKALLAIQTLFVASIITGFRHSIRVPAELRARWLLHVVQPADQSAFLAGAKRAALVKLVSPALMGLLPLHLLAFDWKTAILHSAFGLLLAMLLIEALLLKYRRLPFASSYVPSTDMNTKGLTYVIASLAGVYALAALERFALSTNEGTLIFFGIAGAALAAIRGVDAWQRREAVAVELDELVELPTLRLELTE